MQTLTNRESQQLINTEKTSEQGMLGCREAPCDVNRPMLREDNTALTVCTPNSTDANPMKQRWRGPEGQADPQAQAWAALSVKRTELTGTDRPAQKQNTRYCASAHPTFIKGNHNQALKQTSTNLNGEIIQRMFLGHYRIKPEINNSGRSPNICTYIAHSEITREPAGKEEHVLNGMGVKTQCIEMCEMQLSRAERDIYSVTSLY